MFKPLELFIGLRYTRAKRRNHFISFIALTSMLGIALGVMALITVLSVMNGFQKELRARILGVVAHATVSAAGILPRLKRFSIVGIFEIGMYEYDSALARLDLDDAAKLYRLDGVSGVRLKLDDMMRAPRIARDLERALSADYEVSDWTRQHVNFFRAVQTEKTVMFVILSLIIAVAAFNIVSTLVMMVRDKESDIAVLRTLG